MTKQTLYGAEARNKILEGVKKIVDAIRITLGPMGRNCVIAQSAIIDYGAHSLPLHSTKDGYTVAKCFDLSDYFEKVGVMMIKESTTKTVDQAGDGTTTCAVLAHAILEQGIKLVNAGANPMELKRGIDKAVEYVVSEIEKMAVPIKGDIEKIRQIATISGNNDPEIGNWIAQAFEKIGSEGIIDLEASSAVNTEIKIANGYKWSHELISQLFLVNREKQVTEYENPLILLYDKIVNHHTQLQRALELSNAARRPLLIVCEDLKDEGRSYVAINVAQQRVQCCVVKAPSFGYDRKLQMEDLATLTGGTYISELKGMGIDEIEPSNFGKAKKVIVSKDEVIIIEGESDGDAIETLLNELRMNLAQAKTEDEKYPIEKRIARITGGVAVIQVGAATETEMKEKLDRFDDAVRATKAAIAEGFVAGGGTTFLRIKTGNEIIDNALAMPLYQICQNAGVKEDEIINEVNKLKGNMGYNAKTSQIEDLVESGIIDPAKVLRCALQNAASSAGLILTTECVIADII